MESIGSFLYESIKTWNQLPSIVYKLYSIGRYFSISSDLHAPKKERELVAVTLEGNINGLNSFFPNKRSIDSRCSFFKGVNHISQQVFNCITVSRVLFYNFYFWSLLTDWNLLWSSAFFLWEYLVFWWRRDNKVSTAVARIQNLKTTISSRNRLKQKLIMEACKIFRRQWSGSICYQTIWCIAWRNKFWATKQQNARKFFDAIQPQFPVLSNITTQRSNSLIWSLVWTTAKWKNYFESAVRAFQQIFVPFLK